MIFKKKNKADKILKTIQENRFKYFADELVNILFLDIDGVINLDINNYYGPLTHKDLMDNVNRFCLENHFKIVVISSWRKYTDYKRVLYDSGLDSKIEILGATKVLERDRETEILEYLQENPKVNKFIILDDGKFNKLEKYQVRTEFEVGFNQEKYKEAIKLINSTIY